MIKEYFEIYKDTPREGPGESCSTLKALKQLHLPENSTILDIGCGPGAQTMDLAKGSNCTIHAIDVFDPFLDRLKNKISTENLHNRITPKKLSMFDLHEEYKDEFFDAIWCEGAIFIKGFKDGLTDWKPFIKQHGYLVVSELSWIKDDIPEEIQNYWSGEYSEMTNVSENIKTAENCGYEIIDAFPISASGWMDNYYIPRENAIEACRDDYTDNSPVQEMFSGTEEEIRMYRKYGEYYGYVFYILKKI